MSQELQIPLLTDLIAKGGNQHREVESEPDMDYSDNENDELQFEADAEDPAADPTTAATPVDPQPDDDDDADYHSVQELLIEEEIRLILDKHMDQAYEEIIRLINHRIS